MDKLAFYRLMYGHDPDPDSEILTTIKVKFRSLPLLENKLSIARNNIYQGVIVSLQDIFADVFYQQLLKMILSFAPKQVPGRIVNQQWTGRSQYRAINDQILGRASHRLEPVIVDIVDQPDKKINILRKLKELAIDSRVKISTYQPRYSRSRATTPDELYNEMTTLSNSSN